DFSQNERQISVDPISLQESTTVRQASFRLVSPPTLTFVSTSLSSSASSSPQSKSFLKKIRKTPNDKPTSRSNLSGSRSSLDDTHLAILENNQRRSQSLGEGRRSSTHTDDFNLGLEKSNTNNNTHMKKSKSKDQNYPDDRFKCGKLCLFLPKGKGKPVSIPSIPSDAQAISRTVSMERFECGSWTSSLHEDAEGDSTNLFFDLPMEMLRCSVSDMQSPVTAAFVFENENDNNTDQDVKEEHIMHS
ncbi:hypothetical protein RND81_12G156700, partial [Saponaria officinalis]